MTFEAAIFDIDGTMIDNNEFHLKAWRQYLKEIGREMSDEEYKENINGKTNQDATEYIYGKKLSKEEAEKYYLKKEEIYRQMYAPHIKPVEGLLELLQLLQSKNIPIAIATSGIMVNIDFMFEHIPMRQYFKEIIYSEDIKKGKPDPEIFLKAAEALNVDPAKCVVFEDSLAGVEAGKAAGMKVVAVTTTHPKDELNDADEVVSDFTSVTVERLNGLFNAA